MTLYKRLPLEKAYNTRELGGYPTVDGHVTTFGQFLRSDDVTNLTEEDVQYLLDYGVSAVLDLRSDLEIERAPNQLATHESIAYAHHSLLSLDSDLDLTELSFTGLSAEDEANLLGKMYIHILESSQTALRDLFQWFTEQKGCVLFHCTAGKDRTGVVAMLLLGLVNVSEADIVANYAVTEIYNAVNPKEVMMNIPMDMPAAFLASKPPFIQEAYNHIIEVYQSIENYLLHIGVSEAELKVIKEKLIATS